MAVVNTKSAQITNADAGSVTLSDNKVLGGNVKALVATVEVAVADEDLSVYRMVRVHSSWLILSINAYCDAITAGTDFNVGLYQTAANGGAVASESLFADAVTLATAITAGSDLRFQAGDIAGNIKPVWELLALTVDNNRWYDLCFTAITVGSAAGTVSVLVLVAGN